MYIYLFFILAWSGPLSFLMFMLRSLLLIPGVVWLVVVAVVVIVHGFHRRNIINGEISEYLDKLVLWTLAWGPCG